MFNTIEIKQVKTAIGDLAKISRKQRQLTQIDLADRLNVFRNTIQNLEAGKNFTAGYYVPLKNPYFHDIGGVGGDFE